MQRIKARNIPRQNVNGAATAVRSSSVCGEEVEVVGVVACGQTSSPKWRKGYGNE